MENNIRVINIKEVVKKLISAWKKILLVGIGVGVIFVALVLFSKEDVNTEPITDSDEQTELTTEEKLYDWQKKDVEQLMYLYNRKYYYEMYLSDSIVFNMGNFLRDYKLNYARVQFYVSLNNKNENMDNNYYQDNLVAMYVDYVNSVEFAEALAELLYKEMEINIEHIQDLITVENSGGMIYVYVYMTEEGTEDQLYSFIKDNIESKKELYNQLIEHEIVVVDESTGVLCAEDVGSKLTWVKEQIVITNQELFDKFNKLNIAQKKYLKEVLWSYNYGKYAGNITIPSDETKDDSDKNEIVELLPEIESISVKKGIIVVAAGMIGMIMLYILKFVFSGKIQFSDDIAVSYGLFQFGNIQIDKKFVNKKGQAYQDQIDKVCEAIRLYCVSRNIDKLLIYGGIDLTDIEQINEIKEGLKKHQISVEVVSYKQDASNALKMAVENKNVVIVEAVDESKYRDVELQLAMLEKYDVNVIGGVVLTKY